MRQKIFYFLLFLISLLSLLPITQSYAIVLGSPIKPPVNQTLFGDDYYYTVTFRGNGAAAIAMKAIFTNTTNAPLSLITLHTPSTTSINNVIAYQVLAQPQCIQYSNAPIDNPKCLQYQQPNYQYVDDNTSYKKISLHQAHNTLQLVLPTPLNPNDTGSYLISYRTSSYTHHTIFGAYTFSFQTLKAADPIETVTVGVTTDSDLYLKDAKGTVNYNTPAMSSIVLPKTADTAIANPRFNDFYNQVGEGTIVKSASNLESEESYTVKGMYADAGIKLYGKEIAITIGCILLVLLIVFLLAAFLLKHKSKNIKKTHLVDTRIKLFFAAAGISFGSVLLASAYTAAILMLSLFISTNNDFPEVNSIFLFLLIAALSGAVYLFLLFIPTVIMTIKKGFIWGGVTFGLTIMWAVFAAILLFGVMFLFFASNTSSYSFIHPLNMGSIPSNSVAPQAKGL